MVSCGAAAAICLHERADGVAAAGVSAPGYETREAVPVPPLNS